MGMPRGLPPLPTTPSAVCCCSHLVCHIQLHSFQAHRLQLLQRGLVSGRGKHAVRALPASASALGVQAQGQRSAKPAGTSRYLRGVQMTARKPDETACVAIGKTELPHSLAIAVSICRPTLYSRCCLPTQPAASCKTCAARSARSDSQFWSA
jgi:hypothetical protein